MEVIISFEASGKWPEDNLAAIQRAKLAFLLKIGSSLEESNEEIKAYIGLEEVQRDVEDLAFLDVVYPSGYSFRVRVYSGLEETLLERQTKDKTLERHQRTEAAELLAVCRRTYVTLPLHSQTIATFCTQFPELSPTIRLVKRFFAAHKLSCHFNEELLELFALQAFLRPHPYRAPTGASTGFLRTLLLLSRWDWRDEPLIIDTSGGSGDSTSSSSVQQQRADIRTRLAAWRKIDPNMNRTVLFVATPHDASGTAYTTPPRNGGGNNTPSKVVATRMTTLARSACRLAREKGLELDPRALFQPSLTEYDVLLHLARRTLRNLQRGDDHDGGKSSSSHFKNLAALSTLSEPRLPLPEHPAQTLLARLDAVYGGGGGGRGSPLLFFHGGSADDGPVAALWNPQLHPRAFTANMPCAFRPAGPGGESTGEDGEDDNCEGKKQKYEVDKQAILAEIARIGGDLIEKIEVRGKGGAS